MKTSLYLVNQVKYSDVDYHFGTFFTSPEWVSFLEKNQKATPIVLKLMDDKKIVGYFISLKIKKMGFKIVGSPFEGWLTPDMGFINVNDLDYSKAVSSIVDYIFHKLKCHYIQICDKQITTDVVTIKHKIEYTQLLKIDITKSEEEILAMFTKNGRRDVRASSRKGVRVIKVPFDKEFVEVYYDQLIDVFAKQGLKPNYSLRKLYDMVDSLQSKQESVLALEAINEYGKIIATVFSFGENDWAYYVGAASYRVYQGQLPNEALFWEFIKFWKNRGIKYIDLMGYRKYKLKYNPEITNQPRLVFQKIPGLYFGKKVANRIVRLVRKIKGLTIRKKGEK